MAALAYRDDKILARKLLSHPFFCLTPAEPFFRPDRSSTAPSCRVAVKDGRAFRGHPKGLSLTAARAMARWRSRGGRHAWQQSTARHHGDRRGFPVPVPASLQKSGNSYREVHRLSRFRDHRTACSCLPGHGTCATRTDGTRARIRGNHEKGHNQGGEGPSKRGRGDV